MSTSPRIDRARLIGRLDSFNRIGALPGGGNCRLALSDEDRAGRDLLVQWMRDLDLTVTIDAIGNIIGVRQGREDAQGSAPVMFGSHVDTVGTGGRYDGLYGVLAGLEACQALNDAGHVTRRPLALVAFTNEEGSRFPPYAMGSLVYVGGLALDQAYAIRGIDGTTVGEELRRIRYVGDATPGWLIPHAYLELHIEQGPVLEDEGLAISAVEAITGLTWTEVTVAGRSAHAGTTPMHLRHDAAYVAGEIAVFARRLAREMGGQQKCTVGRIELYPNLVNVIAERATLTLDLRNTDAAQLAAAERELAAHIDRLAAQEKVSISTRSLARFDPVTFPTEIVSLVETTAADLGLPCRRLPSGAGHDAQMMARLCPSGMIFVPSVGGLSHNVREETKPEHLEAGAATLMHAVMRLAE
jgi:N-carbamoyl-L-amino-acid hydrolase